MSLFQRLFADNFEDGVLDATDKKVAFIDPTEFKDINNSFILKGNKFEESDVTPEHIEVLVNMLERQQEGITDMLSESRLKELALGALNKGPYSYKHREWCIVNNPEQFFENKNFLTSEISSTHLDELQDVKGLDDDWAYLAGAHEGEHCNSQRISRNLPNDELRIKILTVEIEADKKALQLIALNRGIDLTESLKDIRAIGTFNNVSSYRGSNLYHPSDRATNTSLDKVGAVNVTYEQIEAVEIFVQEMYKGVSKELGISYNSSVALLAYNPNKFIDTIDILVERNEFYDPDLNQDITGQNPHVQEYIKDYAEAYRRLELNKLQNQENIFTNGISGATPIDRGYEQGNNNATVTYEVDKSPDKIISEPSILMAMNNRNSVVTNIFANNAHANGRVIDSKGAVEPEQFNINPPHQSVELNI